MGVFQCVGRLERDHYADISRKRAAHVKDLRERNSVHVLHNDAEFRRVAVIIDVYDIFVLEGGCQPGLPFEALYERGIALKRLLQLFDGHGPVERLLDGLVDRSHAPRTELLQYLVFIPDLFRHRTFAPCSGASPELVYPDHHYRYIVHAAVFVRGPDEPFCGRIR